VTGYEKQPSYTEHGLARKDGLLSGIAENTQHIPHQRGVRIWAHQCGEPGLVSAPKLTDLSFPLQSRRICRFRSKVDGFVPPAANSNFFLLCYKPTIEATGAVSPAAAVLAPDSAGFAPGAEVAGAPAALEGAAAFEVEEGRAAARALGRQYLLLHMLPRRENLWVQTRFTRASTYAGSIQSSSAVRSGLGREAPGAYCL
jgi:hypothetical protein